jgi:hypothetical protein
MVTIAGGRNSGTSIAQDFVVGPGRSMQLAGTIVEELPDSYIVELDAKFDGKRLIRVAKTRQTVS